MRTTTSTRRPTNRWHTLAQTALGELTIVRDPEAVTGLYYPHHWYRPDPSTFGPPGDDGFDDVIRQLEQYLAGERRSFTVPLRADGEAWQQQVWDLVSRIPYGCTQTYGALAAAVGGDIDARQVGVAVGRNPLCILVPCHRVVSRDGKLTGYAGGLARKRQLLDLERSHTGPFQPTLGLELR
jgi:methylated-DNA-[protein]-cysteine S-methyltransferase